MKDAWYFDEEEQALPDLFGIYYDIYTKQELVDHLDWLTVRLEGLQIMIKDQGVDLSNIIPSDQ